MRKTLVILIGLSLYACKKEESLLVPPNFSIGEAPIGFPEIPFPEENSFSKEKWDLGKKLFYDPILSIDNSISCGSCHQPGLAFSDDKAFSDGASGTIGVRNSPSIANIAYHPYFTREGGVPTLEMQVLVPIQEHNEFNHNIVDIADQLNQDSSYVELSLAAFDRRPDPYVITRAIATFERTLVSGNSGYDKYEYQGNNNALDQRAIQGMHLFFSDRTNCSACHANFNFTDYTFKNNGLYEDYEDPGRFRLTGDSTDLALFKVPSLRNVALTAPYMHDGSMHSLTQVVNHYNQGGNNHPNKSDLIKPLNLTQGEVASLVSFLEGLTDYSLITNQILQP